jgi:S1-C subfamily serine protease
MTTVDWIIVAFTVLLALYGYAQGFIVGALSLAGFVLGAFIGTRIGPLLLAGGAHSQYAPLFGLAGALLAGGVLASGFEGVGAVARRALRLPGLRTIDGLLGAALTAAVALAIAWILGAVVLQSSGSLTLQQDVQRSAILRELNRLLPPSGSILNALARFDPLPPVAAPPADVPGPSSGIAAAPAVVAAVHSVVRVLGTACGLGIEGSGWVAAPHLVVTNAHVVAGESDTVIEAGGRPPDLPVTVLVFDPRNDIAVLRVPALDERPLPLAARQPSGTSAGIIGYPENGPLRIRAGRIGAAERVRTENAYGQGPVLRTIVPLRGLVQPGNSGGPMVDAAGQVVATVFAAITGQPAGQGPGGFAIPDRLVAAAVRTAEARTAPVSTEQCAG